MVQGGSTLCITLYKWRKLWRHAANMRSWKHTIILKIKPRHNGFCIESSVSECLIIVFEKDRENVSKRQNVEFRNYTEVAFLYGRWAWKKISTPQNTGDQLRRFESNLTLGIVMKILWTISKGILFIESLTTTIFWNVVPRMFVDGYQHSVAIWNLLLLGLSSKYSFIRYSCIYFC